MNRENSKTVGLKQKITYQFEELARISVYLAFFFCAVSTYKMLLLNEFHVSHFDYGAALINALVIGKVVLIGQDVTLAKSMKPSHCLFRLYIRRFCSACWYSVFTLLRKSPNDLCMGKTWRERSTTYASMICLPAVSSYFALSSLSFCSWNCAGCWATTNSTTCFSEQEQLQNLIAPSASERK